jgi:hypothetical protein
VATRSKSITGAAAASSGDAFSAVCAIVSSIVRGSNNHAIAILIGPSEVPQNMEYYHLLLWLSVIIIDHDEDKIQSHERPSEIMKRYFCTSFNFM